MDVGTGDGLFVYNYARQNPRTFFIGIDANRRPLKKISERIHRKPSKGGLPNILFVQSAVESLPSELEGVANEVHVNFPWGTLLSVVAGGNAAALSNLRRICSRDAFLKVVVGFDPLRNRAEMERLQLPSLSIKYVETTLASHYKKAGFEIVESEMGTVADMELETSWARRLRRNANRFVIRFLARAIADSPQSRIGSLESYTA